MIIFLTNDHIPHQWSYSSPMIYFLTNDHIPHNEHIHISLHELCRFICKATNWHETSHETDISWEMVLTEEMSNSYVDSVVSRCDTLLWGILNLYNDHQLWHCALLHTWLQALLAVNATSITSIKPYRQLSATMSNKCQFQFHSSCNKWSQAMKSLPIKEQLILFINVNIIVLKLITSE